MKLGPVTPRRSNLGNLLPRRHCLPLLDQNSVVVCVGAKELLVVVDNDQLAISEKSAACVHHLSIGGCVDWITGGASKVDSLVDPPGRRIGFNNRARSGPPPLHGTCYHRLTYRLLLLFLFVNGCF